MLLPAISSEPLYLKGGRLSFLKSHFTVFWNVAMQLDVLGTLNKTSSF